MLAASNGRTGPVLQAILKLWAFQPFLCKNRTRRTHPNVLELDGCQSDMCLPAPDVSLGTSVVQGPITFLMAFFVTIHKALLPPFS